MWRFVHMQWTFSERICCKLSIVSGVAFGMPKGVFTLTETETETDKKWVVWDCVEVFILTETDTVTDVNRLQTHFIGIGLCRCEHTITFIDVITYNFFVTRGRLKTSKDNLPVMCNFEFWRSILWTHLFDMQEIFHPERYGASVDRWVIVERPVVRYIRSYRERYRLRLKR